MLWIGLAVLGALVLGVLIRQLIRLSLLILVIGLLAQSWLTGWALANLQTQPRLKHGDWRTKNAIVVLGAGAVTPPLDDTPRLPIFGQSRVLEAARLYFDCRSQANECHVIASGGDPAGTGRAEADLMDDAFEELKIPKADIRRETRSRSTFANAREMRGFLPGYTQIYLVTSGVHLNRAQLYFRHFGIATRGAPADYLQASTSLWPSLDNFTYLGAAIHEDLGVAHYHVYQALGWNPPRFPLPEN